MNALPSFDLNGQVALVTGAARGWAGPSHSRSLRPEPTLPWD